MKTLIKAIFIMGLFAGLAMNLSAQEIFDAVRIGNFAKVKELVEKDPQLARAKDARQATLLHIAAEIDHPEIAEYLIDRGADVNAPNGFFFTPLMRTGIKVAKILVEKGADLHYQTPEGHTVMDGLLLRMNKDVSEYLLEQGAEISDLNSRHGFASLINALQMGNVPYLEKSLQKGLSSRYESPAKNTLLHFAAAGDSVDLIRRLTDLGAPLNQENIYGWTPLHTAAYHGRKSVVEFLIQKGLDKNARCADGNSPYNLAHEMNKKEVIEYLRAVGAETSAPKFPVLKGPYFGQPKPGRTAVPFAPGILAARSRFHGSPAFSPDGTEVYWSVQERQSLQGSKRVGDQWTKPEAATFGPFGDAPFISPDGKKIIFIGVQDIQGRPKELIFVRDKTAAGWSEAYLLPEIINAFPEIHHQVSMDLKGDLFFATLPGGMVANGAVYWAKYEHGQFRAPQEIIKAATTPYISPDGSYLIVSNSGLKILFKKKDGTWTSAQSISAIIGTDGNCPNVTADGQYMFFLKTVDAKNIPFWVEASFIEDLRKEALKDDR